MQKQKLNINYHRLMRKQAFCFIIYKVTIDPVKNILKTILRPLFVE